MAEFSVSNAAVLEELLLEERRRRMIASSTTLIDFADADSGNKDALFDIPPEWKPGDPICYNTVLQISEEKSAQ